MLQRSFEAPSTLHDMTGISNNLIHDIWSESRVDPAEDHSIKSTPLDEIRSWFSRLHKCGRRFL